MVDDCKNNYMINLQKLSQEELELRIDSLLAKCRTEVDIAKTAEQGAMFSKGPFQISISLAIKMKKYQDELLYCRRNPYDVLLSVCTDNGWGVPEFRAVDYTVGKGFLFCIIVNDHELVSKWRDRRPLIAADLAAANFLRYLGLWVNVKNLNLIFDWEQITSDGMIASNEDKVVGNINGYLYFMGFNVVKTETTIDEASLKSVVSLKANIQLQLSKLIYSFLTSREEKACWITDIDIYYFKRLFGELKSDASYILNNESWNSDEVCSCKNKRFKICFVHEEYFFYFFLKDYFYVNEFGPVDPSIFEKLKEMKTEKEEVVKTELEETTQETKPRLVEEALSDKVKYIKKEKLDEVEAKEIKHSIDENSLKRLNHVKQERDDENQAKIESKEILKQKELLREVPISIRKPPSSPTCHATETPLNLRLQKFDLRSKLFGKSKSENLVKDEKVDFKVSFDSKTGLSNIKSSVGSWISVADISPPRIPLANPVKRTSSSNITTVVTSQRKKRKSK